MNDTRTAETGNGAATFVAPGAGTPEGELWRTILGGESSAPFMLLTDNANFVHPGDSDGLTRPVLNRRNHNTVNYQIGMWAVESLGHEEPEARRFASEALSAAISYEDLDLARHWVIYQGGVFGFLCAFSPAERVREMARRYASTVQAIEVDLAVV